VIKNSAAGLLKIFGRAGRASSPRLTLGSLGLEMAKILDSDSLVSILYGMHKRMILKESWRRPHDMQIYCKNSIY
jgi:hypothetical protein